MVMLIAVGWIAGHNFQTRFSFMIFAFGTWDIFYYLWLRVFIGWPHTIMDPDLLFLIPLPWWGPVLSPVLIAMLMIASGIIIVIKDEKRKPIHYSPWFWALLISGILLMLYSFMADAIRALPADSSTLSKLKPSQFNWLVYLIGLVMALISVLLLTTKRRKNQISK